MNNIPPALFLTILLIFGIYFMLELAWLSLAHGGFAWRISDANAVVCDVQAAFRPQSTGNEPAPCTQRTGNEAASKLQRTGNETASNLQRNGNETASKRQRNSSLRADFWAIEAPPLGRALAFVGPARQSVVSAAVNNRSSLKEAANRA